MANYGDSAVTIPVGQITPELERLLQVTRESLELAIHQLRVGNRLGDVCSTVQEHVEKQG